jgi:hypothetical protein
MRERDPYAVLGVRRGASPDEIRRAWVDLARRHHPDRGGDPATMQAINDAWAALRTGAPPAPDPDPDPDPGPDVGVDGAGGWFDGADVAAFDVAYRPRPVGLSAFAPVGLFALSVAIGCIALALDEPALLGFAAFVFFLSCIAIAASTLWSMRR